MFAVNMLYFILGLIPDVHLGQSLDEIYDHMIDMVRYFLSVYFYMPSAVHSPLYMTMITFITITHHCSTLTFLQTQPIYLPH